MSETPIQVKSTFEVEEDIDLLLYPTDEGDPTSYSSFIWIENSDNYFGMIFYRALHRRDASTI